MPPATRVEIADCLDGAFSAGAATRSDLLAVAGDAGARIEVLDLLDRLPQRPYNELRELWNSLPDVPIEVDAPVVAVT